MLQAIIQRVGNPRISFLSIERPSQLRPDGVSQILLSLSLSRESPFCSFKLIHPPVSCSARLRLSPFRRGNGHHRRVDAVHRLLCRFIYLTHASQSCIYRYLQAMSYVSREEREVLVIPACSSPRHPPRPADYRPNRTPVESIQKQSDDASVRPFVKAKFSDQHTKQRNVASRVASSSRPQRMRSSLPSSQSKRLTETKTTDPEAQASRSSKKERKT